MKVTDRFLDKVYAEPNTGCWLWASSCDEHGYGRFSYRGKNRKAHRIAYRLFVGPIRGTCVLHRCDNPACVNPHHLWRGTQEDNIADMDAKGRRAKGAANGRAKLSRSAVLDIYARAHRDDANVSALAREHGVSRRTVRSIRDGELWSHLTGHTREAA